MFRKPKRLVIEALEERLVLSLPDAAPSLGLPPSAGPGVVWVSDAPSLQNAVNKAQSGETIVIEPGTYNLTETLNLGLSGPVSNVTIRGATDNFGDVVIHGFGMDNPNFGNCPFDFQLWNSANVTIADLSAGDAWFSAVQIQPGITGVHLYHDRFFDTGEQLIKGNASELGTGVSDSTVQFCQIEYTNGPSSVDHGGGTGYTNGISALRASGWDVSDNLFRNLYTPDTDQNLWDPAVLFWDQSSNNVVERNTFVKVDRAIAFGLFLDNGSTTHDNVGGVIRNNFIVQPVGLFSAGRNFSSDGTIIAWDSPGTLIDHNTILNQGSGKFAIEVRWNGTGVEVRNNLADAPINARDGANFDQSGNFLQATADMFADPASGDLHLVSNAATQANVIDKVTAPPDVTDDWDGEARPIGPVSDIGADEFGSNSPTIIPPPPTSGLTIGDAGFETPIADPLGYAYDPTGSAWTFASSAGLTGNGTAFTSDNLPAPEGSQVAFIQGTGGFSQTVSGWTAGDYQLSFDAAQRGNCNTTPEGNDFLVKIDDITIGYFRPIGTDYQTYTTATFAVSAGTHTLTFQGLGSFGGDNTAFVDAVTLTTAATSPPSDGTLVNAGFESPGGLTGFGGYVYDPTGADWTFAGSAGVSGNGTGFTINNPPAPEGSQVAFIQDGGSFSQTIGGLTSGSYQLTFDAAQRGNCQSSPLGNDFQIAVDGIVIGYFLPNGTDYQPFTTTFSVSGGTHTITFQGLDSAGGDNTAFIDDVRLTQNV